MSVNSISSSSGSSSLDILEQARSFKQDAFEAVLKSQNVSTLEFGKNKITDAILQTINRN